MLDPSVLVVISYYNARPDDRLDNLLSQLQTVPAGGAFDTMVVVNRAVDEGLAIAAKYPRVRVCYRENAGYNIGAWDHGWRTAPAHDVYVFLQDECLIARKGWLRRLRDKALGGRGRLVGVCLFDPAETWADSQLSCQAFHVSRGWPASRWDEESGDLHTPVRIRGPASGPAAIHLRDPSAMDGRTV